MQQIQEALEGVGLNLDNVRAAQMTALAQEVIRERGAGNMGNNIDLLLLANRVGINFGRETDRNEGIFGPLKRKLDPNLPLLQLLWQTFMPWNYI